MSIVNYAKKLVIDGDLKYQSEQQIDYEALKFWTPDFMESIVFIKVAKPCCQSVLHFFWGTIFHLREVKGQIEAQEIFSSTHLYKIQYKDVINKIKSINSEWYQANKTLIPTAKWFHLIWNDDNDVFITFEDEEYYYGWGWDCTL